MIERLGVAVSGLGVGERHARKAAALAETTVRQVYDPSTSKRARVAAEIGAAEAGSFETLLEDPAVDVIVVASPDHRHAEQIVAALRSGRHVFAEKPLCNTPDELALIMDEWRRTDGRLHLQSNLVLRAAPLYLWLKAAIVAGTFGEVYAFDGDYLYGRLEKVLTGWRGTGANYSGIKGGGVHLIDLMCWLTGQKPSRAFTVGSNICTRGSSVLSTDHMSTTFRFESGLVGRITANLGCVHRHHHFVRVFGTKATFIYDDLGPRVHTSRDPAMRASAVALDPLPAGKSDLFPGFIEGIRTGRDRRRETEEEFATVSVCFASDASLASSVEEPIVYL